MLNEMFLYGAELTVDDRHIVRHDLVQLLWSKLLGDVLLQILGVSQVCKVCRVLEKRRWKV